MTDVQLLLDEHVGRVVERLLRERGYTVEQANDRFGEQPSDIELIRWCDELRAVLVTNNAKDVEPLHHDHDHPGIRLSYDQNLPATDPEGLARTVDEVFTQYGLESIDNRPIDLGEWYEWLHE